MFEREFSVSASEQKIREAISSLSLIPSVKYIDSCKTVATCTLSDDSGSAVAEGAGKGQHCQLGALAESIEHYALEHCSSNGLVSRRIYEVRRQASIKLDGILANLPDSEALIDCVELKDISNGSLAAIPAVMQLPDRALVEKNTSRTDTAFLSRYSTNSGIAFGCSENEAILHGLNEVLERHMLSKILMSLCGQYDSILMRSVDVVVMRQVFPGSSRFCTLATSMKILITETIQGVYFAMAIPKQPDGRYIVCPLGSGCSVDPRIAIERAATELHQTMALYDEVEKATDHSAFALANYSSTLRPLINLEVLRNTELSCKRLDPPRRLSVQEQVEFILEKVEVTGLRAFKRTLLDFENGCVVAQVYVPGLERFNLIRAGIPVVPQHLLHANKCYS
uniref:YcaO domain-containing protein n=1 Tax=Pseudomonas graminis TaxID=158627 RepID=A0A7C1WSV9_9PSED